MQDPPEQGRHGRLLLAVIGATVGIFLMIGARFLLDPETAVRTFGVAEGGGARVLARAIGLRDLWLVGLAGVFLWLREWRALGVWLVLGALVCAGDAALVLADGGRAGALTFHAAASILWAVLAALCLRRTRGR
jgi:hypothetical protein